MADEKKPKTRRRGPQPKVSEEHMIVALRKAGGVMSQAAKMLRVSRVTVYRHVSRKPELQALIAELQEEAIDFAETQLQRLVKDRKHKGHPQAVFFTLKTLGKKRGYAERHELTGPAEGDKSATPLVVYLPKLDPES